MSFAMCVCVCVSVFVCVCVWGGVDGLSLYIGLIEVECKLPNIAGSA